MSQEKVAAPEGAVEEEQIREVGSFYVGGLGDELRSLVLVKVLCCHEHYYLFKKSSHKTFYYIPSYNKLIKMWLDDYGNLLTTFIYKKPFFANRFEYLPLYGFDYFAIKCKTGRQVWGIENLPEGDYNLILKVGFSDKYAIKFNEFNPFDILDNDYDYAKMVIALYLLLFYK